MANKFISTDPSAVVTTANSSQIDTLNSAGTVNGLVGESTSSASTSSVFSGTGLDGQVSSLTSSVAKTSSTSSNALSGLLSESTYIPTSDTLLAANSKKLREKASKFTASANAAVLGIVNSGHLSEITADNYLSLAANSLTTDYTDHYGNLKDSLSGLADTGDIFSLDSVLSTMSSGGIEHNSLIDSLVPNLTGNILKNLDISKLMPNVPTAILVFASKHVITILNKLSSNWYYLDESRGLYNHSVLSKLPASTLSILAASESYIGITELSRSLNAHTIADQRRLIEQTSL